jgi:hypothetical protein
MPTDVTVKLDDRARLLSAALAVTRYPEHAQKRRPHGTHAHARATIKQLAPLADHPAILDLQGLLDQGAPLEALFTLIMTARPPDLTIERPPRWMPPNWGEKLRDFMDRAALSAWWKSEEAAWNSAREDAGRMFASVSFKPFLRPFVGEIMETLVFIPNITYPTDQELGLRLGRDLTCIAPPRLAWGDSPPWPYDEDPTHIYRAALTQYAKMLMIGYLRAHADVVAEASKQPIQIGDAGRAKYPTWQDQFVVLFVAGAVAIFLEDHVNKAEADAYVLIERKTNNLGVLPAVIKVLRRYLTERESGKFDTLLDFLPVFPKQLRVTTKIQSL